MKKFTVVTETLPISKITGVKTARLSGQFAVIVKVNKPNYVPNGFVVRSTIDATMFTANVEASALAAIEEDPFVVAVSVSQRLQVVE